MEHELKVKEQFSPKWKLAAVLSSIAAALFFVIFLFSSDPLWKGIFRFVAFIGFIVAVFSFLRLREGQKKIRLELKDNHLLITYLHKSKSVKEELFERKTIANIYKKKEIPFTGIPFIDQGYRYFISFTDTENDLPLFMYSGRNLHFSQKTAKNIDRFVEKFSSR